MSSVTRGCDRLASRKPGLAVGDISLDVVIGKCQQQYCVQVSSALLPIDREPSALPFPSIFIVTGEPPSRSMTWTLTPDIAAPHPS